jgi:hypothetical protein
VVIKESVVGEGKMCGAIFVDQRFEEFIRGRLIKRWNKLRPDQIRKIMTNEWEFGIKRRFVDDNTVFNVQLPAEATGTGMFHRAKPSSLTLERYRICHDRVSFICLLLV